MILRRQSKDFSPLPFQCSSIILQYFREYDFANGLDLLLAFCSNGYFYPSRDLVRSMLVNLIVNDMRDKSLQENKILNGLFKFIHILPSSILKDYLLITTVKETIWYECNLGETSMSPSKSEYIRLKNILMEGDMLEILEGFKKYFSKRWKTASIKDDSHSQGNNDQLPSSILLRLKYQYFLNLSFHILAKEFEDWLVVHQFVSSNDPSKSVLTMASNSLNATTNVSHIDDLPLMLQYFSIAKYCSWKWDTLLHSFAFPELLSVQFKIIHCLDQV